MQIFYADKSFLAMIAAARILTLIIGALLAGSVQAGNLMSPLDNRPTENATASRDIKKHRSIAAKRPFRARQPCPETERYNGACPGYVIDHIEPLCAGGADHWTNMQWQRIEDAKAKDRLERQQCS